MMKNKLLLLLLGFVVCASFLNAQSLDEAILGAAVKISRDLPAGATVAITDFASDSKTQSDYVITELSGAILRTRRITAVSQDQNPRYQITGSLELAGSEHRITFTAADTESGEKASEYSALLNLSGAGAAVAAGEQKQPKDTRFNTIGISLGSAFFGDLFIVAVNGSFSPVKNMYIELGCDFGFVYYDEDKSNYNYNPVSYLSILPFAHVGFFAPFNKKGGFFIGAGAGYMVGLFTFPWGKASESVFVADITTGFNLWNWLNISYTLRTNLKSINHKIALGYSYRFKQGENNAKN